MKHIHATAVMLAVAATLAACSADKPTAEAPRPVRTAEIRYDAAREANRYAATVQSRYEVEQAFRVGGKVARRLVEVGQTVREGDVLAVLDDSDYRLAEEAATQQWAAAVTQARQAESDRLRLANLKADGSVSAADDERAHSGATTAQAAAEAQARQLELARNRLKYTVLRATRSGVVTAVRFEVGQVVPEGQPVVAIADPGTPEIVVDVPEDQLAGFRKARFQAALASAPAETFDVSLRELAAGRAADAHLPRPAEADAGPVAAAGRDRDADDRPDGVGDAGGIASGQRDHAVRRPARAVGGQAVRQGGGGRHRRAGACPVAWLSQRRGAGLRPSGRRTGRHRGRAEDGARTEGRPARGGAGRSQRHANPCHAAGRAMNRFNLTDWALRHRAIVLFLLLVVAVAGVFSFSKLGQLEDPNFSVPSMTAMVVWPGATAQQMQDEVLNRMEKKFEQIDHFEKVVTFARQGFGGMTLTVKGGTSKADQREAWYQARKKLGDLRLEMPEA